MARYHLTEQQGSMRDLFDFHTRNKFLLMTYNQKELKEIRKLVANPGKQPEREVFSAYDDHLLRSLSRSPRYTSNINVLMHALFYFSGDLTSREKFYFLDSLERNCQGAIPLSVNIHIIKSWIIWLEQPYLCQQT